MLQGREDELNNDEDEVECTSKTISVEVKPKSYLFVRTLMFTSLVQQDDHHNAMSVSLLPQSYCPYFQPIVIGLMVAFC